MKILFVSNVSPTPDAGAAGTDYQTVLALRALGHDVDTVWYDGLPHSMPHPMLGNLFELPGALRNAIIACCAKKDYDVIQVNQPYAYLAAKNHQRSSRSATFVIRSHGFEARADEVLRFWSRKLGVKNRSGVKALLGRALDLGLLRACRLAARHADGFVVSCTDDARFLSQSYGLADRAVGVIPQAPPKLFLETPVVPFSETRWRRILFVGPPQLWKGIPFLVEAMSTVLKETPEASFTWVSHEEDHDHIRSLFEPELQSRIHVEPYCSQEELMSIYDSCGVFVFPSVFEGFGKAPLEAASRGLATIASNTGGMADLMTNGKNGLLVEPGNAAELTMAVRLVLGDFKLASEFSEGGREMAAEYTWERVARESVAFFDRLREGV